MAHALLFERSRAHAGVVVLIAGRRHYHRRRRSRRFRQGRRLPAKPHSGPARHCLQRGTVLLSSLLSPAHVNLRKRLTSAECNISPRPRMATFTEMLNMPSMRSCLSWACAGHIPRPPLLHGAAATTRGRATSFNARAKCAARATRAVGKGDVCDKGVDAIGKAQDRPPSKPT